MTTFVLVHGAWHGGWCWDRVAPLLRDAGHEVHAPWFLEAIETERGSSPRCPGRTTSARPAPRVSS